MKKQRTAADVELTSAGDPACLFNARRHVEVIGHRVLAGATFARVRMECFLQVSYDPDKFAIYPGPVPLLCDTR